MAAYLDSVPFSSIIRIRDMMFALTNPFRLDQGDVSFDAPDSVKDAMVRAIAENKTHYLQTNGVPRLRELMAAKMRTKNGIPVEDPEDVLVTNGGIHGVYMLCQALLEPGDEVLVPNPEWPPVMGNVACAHGVSVPYPLHEDRGWRPDLDEVERLITPKTRMLYVNSPNNPSGGILTRADLEQLAALAVKHNLWVISDEAYEDVVFEGEHFSMASLPGMYERTIPLFTFSKSYAMTGLRLGYVAVKDPVVRDRCKKILLYTASNVASVVQYGAIGALEGPQDCIEYFRTELQTRRDLFYAGLAELPGTPFTGEKPPATFYAMVKINPSWTDNGDSTSDSLSWRMTEYLIKHARIGCVPGVDFGSQGEGHIRFCFSRSREELTGAIESMKAVFGAASV